MMKHLSLMIVAVVACTQVGASPNGEEFVIEEIQGAEVIAPIRTQPIPGLRSRRQQSLSKGKLNRVVEGVASWYGPGFYGRKTASGERLSKDTMTAAHRTLPFGTKVRVTNLSNGRSVVVRINDRGPFKGHRVIDLAHGAASQLRMMKTGVEKVRLEVIEK